MRSTHTYAVLEISPEAHAEIKAKLLAAGYEDQIHGDTVDMHGIAVEPVESRGPRLRFSASIYPNRVDFETHSRDVTWQYELDALNALRCEIERLIAEGPRKCPAAPPLALVHASVPIKSIRQHYPEGVIIDKHGNLSGDPQAIEELKSFCRARPALLNDYIEPNQSMIVDEQAFLKP
jgi:hypothetical protein